MTLVITSLDHIVITVADRQKTLDFYARALGFRVIDDGPERPVAMGFGNQKINVHQVGAGGVVGFGRGTCCVRSAEAQTIVA
jgi:catechol 2,3-dioxygenase-like lactoylglutathione lyase family enzyme